mgnify:CR=1 FL=1
MLSFLLSVLGNIRALAFTLALAVLLGACSNGPSEPDVAGGTFTLAVIPDTQNYLDYKHQSAEGFALDGSDLFIAQMRDVAARNDVAFVAAVGDVWQHQTLEIDPEHAGRGVGRIPNPIFDAELAPTPKALSIEVPKAVEGYQILHEAGIPFGVAPGNHDYDAMWSVEGFPPQLHKGENLTITPEDLGILHIGGLDNFRSVFGHDSTFFKDKPWYVSHFRDGANSAQVFEAGGYRFLHITLEMAADNFALAWAGTVIRDHPHYPTIITTHDYLNTHGERSANPIVDLNRVDPMHHNTAEEVWQTLVSAYDQVFLVLCGHHHGQSHRVDKNHYDHDVHQVLADYQSRGQAGLDAGQPLDPRRGTPRGLGDGWYRLMQFDTRNETPTIAVQTWSSHYRKHASELDSYAQWYRQREQPKASDSEFLAMEEFTIELSDFRERFGPPR